jgi:hypothetical protein
MSTQPEALLEAELVTQLRGMGYGHVAIQDEAGLLANLQAQLEAFNGTTFTPRDMTRILNHLQKGTLYDRSKILRDRYALEREDGTVTYVRFFDGGGEQGGNRKAQRWKKGLFADVRVNASPQRHPSFVGTGSEHREDGVVRRCSCECFTIPPCVGTGSGTEGTEKRRLFATVRVMRPQVAAPLGATHRKHPRNDHRNRSACST